MPARRSSVCTVSAALVGGDAREGGVQALAAAWRRRRGSPGSRSRPPCRPAPRATACPSRSGGRAGARSAGRTRSAGQRAGEVEADAGDALVRAEELVRRAEQHVEAERLAVEAAVRREVHAVGPGQRAGPVREVADAAGVGHGAQSVGGQREGHDPRAVAACAPRARRGRACRRPVPAARVCTVSSWSRATRSHGETFASWSSCVTTISSPGSSVRATAWASRKLSVVMFGAEGDLSGRAAREVGRRGARGLDHGVGLLGGHERRRRGSRSSAQVARDGLDHGASAPASRPGRRGTSPAGPPTSRARAGKCARTAAGSSGAGTWLLIAREGTAWPRRGP